MRRRIPNFLRFPQSCAERTNQKQRESQDRANQIEVTPGTVRLAPSHRTAIFASPAERSQIANRLFAVRSASASGCKFLFAWAGCHRTVSMSSPSIICAAIVVWLSTAAVDPANARGTFRLAGAWPSSSAHNQTNGDMERHLHRSGSERSAHAPRANYH